MESKNIKWQCQMDTYTCKNNQHTKYFWLVMHSFVGTDILKTYLDRQLKGSKTFGQFSSSSNNCTHNRLNHGNVTQQSNWYLLTSILCWHSLAIKFNTKILLGRIDNVHDIKTYYGKYKPTLRTWLGAERAWIAQMSNF